MPRLDFYVDYKLFIKIKLNLETLKIGRSLDCDIQLPSPKVSRVHAVINKSSDGFLLENKSPNGTRINNAMVTPSAVLKPGDRIYIDQYILIYQPDNAPTEEFESEENKTLLFEDLDRDKLNDY